MTKKTGIFYLTYDGVYNYTSGIGTQTKTLLEGLNYNATMLREIVGDFDLNLILPTFDNTTFGYLEEQLHYSNALVAKLGGRIFTCTSTTDSPNSDFWTVPNWERMCSSSSTIILKEAERYDQSIVIAVDSPFLLTPKYMAENNT